MAQISDVYDPNAETANFDVIPAGEYRAKIISSEIEDISKNSSKGRCLKLTWQVETGPYDGRLIWQRISSWAENMNNLEKVLNIAKTQLKSIADAVGVAMPQDSTELEHIPCTIRVAVKTDPSGRYEPQNEVKSVKAVGGVKTPTNTAQTSQATVSQQEATKKKNPWDQ